MIHKTLSVVRNFLKPIYFHKHFSPCVIHRKPLPVCINVHRNYKMFMQLENKYAFEILESKGHLIRSKLERTPPVLCEDLDEYLKQDWNKKSPQDLYEAFGALAKHCSEKNICISNKMFDNFIDAFTDNVKHFTDKELEQSFLHLKLLPETPSVKTRNFIEIWAALDDACLARYKQWTVDEKLKFANLTYEVSIAKTCDYTIKMLQRLVSRTSTLSVPQLLQMTFLIGVLRTSLLDKHNVELYLEKNIDQFSVDDLAVMAMGFFKSKSPIRSPRLIYLIVDRVIRYKEELDDIPLAALFKLIRYSYRNVSENQLMLLLNEYEGQVSRMSITSCVHYALIGSTALIFHETSLLHIIERVKNEISECRLKDLERLMLTMATLYFLPENENFVDMVTDELRKPERKREIEIHGRTLCTCLMYITTLGYYPEDLISLCLDPKFIAKAYGSALPLLGRELLLLHNTALIHCPNYSGNLLPPKSVKFLAQNNTDYVPDENFNKSYNVAETMVLNIKKLLVNILGSNKYVCGDHALPHYQRGDLFLCLDNSGNPVDITDHFPIKRFGDIKPAPTQDKWIAIVIAARNGIIRGTDTFTGPFHAKCRDLRKIGYHPVIASYNNWVKLENDEDRTEYLKNLIKKA